MTVSGRESTNDIYTWIGSQSLPIKIALGPPIWAFGMLLGFVSLVYLTAILIPYHAIAGFVRDRAFRRSMKQSERAVEWRHVRSQLLSNPDEALLVEVSEKGDGYGWCCPHIHCEHLPRYDTYLMQGTRLFLDPQTDDLVSPLREAAVQCMRDGKVLLSPCRDTIVSDPELPKDRVHAIYGSVRGLASLVESPANN